MDEIVREHYIVKERIREHYLLKVQVIKEEIKIKTIELEHYEKLLKSMT